MKQPCIDCGHPANGTRCPEHATIYQQGRTRRQTGFRKMRGTRKYGGDYPGRAAAVRATATHCWLCGGTADPHDPWQADHLEQGPATGGAGGLAPAHRSCNIRRRHLTDRGWDTDRIRQRLHLQRHGPTDPTPPPGAGATPLPPSDPARRPAR